VIGISKRESSYYTSLAASKRPMDSRNVDYLYTAKTDITVYEDKAVVAINWIDS
jgi:hypothetical protein